MATSVTLKPNAIDISGSTSGTTTLQASAVAGTTTLTLPAATDTLVGKATTDTLTNKTLTGAAMNGTLGATTPSTASVTTLTTSSTVTHSGGTANGVAYLDGSKVLTTGSALVFDGTNLGLGVTPSAWSGLKAIQLTNGISLASFSGGATPNAYLSTNIYFNGSNWIFNGTYGASRYEQVSGQHQWFGISSGTAGGTATLPQLMTLDSSGNLGVGTTSPSAKLEVSHSGGTLFKCEILNVAQLNIGNGGNSTNYYDGDTQIFRSGAGTERARIDSSGNLLVGTTSGTPRLFVVGGSGGRAMVIQHNGAVDLLYTPTPSVSISGGGESSANAVLFVTKATTTSRSINAAGTVNQSGADYAEYMTKSGDFTVAKGDVVGINSDGKLTNVFADAISFCVKSTDPGLVGGDVWGTPKALGLPKLTDESTQEEKDVFDAALEAARQKVDRIAFAGQVPVNVMGATAGQYIIPVNDNGAIKGEAVSNPTFEQYQIAVGKVIAIESDGRAKIIVKVA